MDLRRAMELAPDYEFAANRLFDLFLEEGNCESAGEVLAVLLRQSPGDSTSRRAVQLATRRGDGAAAMKHLSELCTGPLRDLAPLNEAIDAVRKVSWMGAAEKLFSEVVDAGRASPIVGTLWIEHLATDGRWSDALDVVDAILSKSDAGRNAAIEFLQRAGEADQSRLVRKCIQQHDVFLRADTQTWGATARALLLLGDYGGVARWMADWKGRQGVGAFMLNDLVISLRRLGRGVEAAEVVRAALALPPDDARADLEVLAAFEEAAAGQAPLAEARLARLDVGALDDAQRYTWHLAEAVNHGDRAAAAAPARRVELLDLAKTAIENAEAAYPEYRSQPGAFRDYCRALSLLARRGFSTRMWCLWRRAKPLRAA
jgi:hypothetical protein